MFQLLYNELNITTYNKIQCYKVTNKACPTIQYACVTLKPHKNHRFKNQKSEHLSPRYSGLVQHEGRHGVEQIKAIKMSRTIDVINGYRNPHCMWESATKFPEAKGITND